MIRSLTPLRSALTTRLRQVADNRCHQCQRLVHNLNDRHNFRYELPPLMDFDPTKTGRPLLTKIKVNWFLKPFVDKHFDPYKFLEGAQQAVSVIGTHLGNDRIEDIKPLVCQKAFEEVQTNYHRLSPGQKLLLRVNKEDIQAAYLFNVGINRLGSGRYKVQMIVVVDVLNNAQQVIEKARQRLVGMDLSYLDFKKNLEIMKPLIDNKFLCIYRFSRDYEPNVKSEWIVDKLVHFKNTDVLRLTGHIK